MNEDEFAAKMHGVYISESDSSNSDGGKSDFDEEYEALKPPSISLEGREQDIIKIAAFKVVSCKNNNSILNKKKPTTKSYKDIKLNQPNRFKKKRNNSKAKSIEIKKHEPISIPLQTKLKLNETFNKPLNTFINNVVDYACAVKSNKPLEFRNGNVQNGLTITDSQKRIKKSRPRKKKSGKDKLLQTDYEKKISLSMDLMHLINKE